MNDKASIPQSVEKREQEDLAASRETNRRLWAELTAAVTERDEARAEVARLRSENALLRKAACVPAAGGVIRCAICEQVTTTGNDGCCLSCYMAWHERTPEREVVALEAELERLQEESEGHRRMREANGHSLADTIAELQEMREKWETERGHAIGANEALHAQQRENERLRNQIEEELAPLGADRKFDSRDARITYQIRNAGLLVAAQPMQRAVEQFHLKELLGLRATLKLYADKGNWLTTPSGAADYVEFIGDDDNISEPWLPAQEALAPPARAVPYICWECKETELLSFPEMQTELPWPPSAVRCPCGGIMNPARGVDADEGGGRA